MYINSAFLFRRMKRWIQEKQQREKNLTTTRRHRHKSLGDVETIPKSKRQQQLFSHSVQIDINPYIYLFFLFSHINKFSCTLWYATCRAKPQILRS